MGFVILLISPELDQGFSVLARKFGNSGMALLDLVDRSKAEGVIVSIAIALSENSSKRRRKIKFEEYREEIGKEKCEQGIQNMCMDFKVSKSCER